MATHLNFHPEEDDQITNPEPQNGQGWCGKLPRTGTVVKKRGTITHCLLVVDDREVNIQSVGAVLGKSGYEIIPAKSGAQALERMATRSPDLVLIDVLRPDVDGFRLCRVIRENPEWAGIPVMIHALAGDLGMAARALASGAADCMTNAFNQTELISRVRAQLCRKTARDKLKRLAEDKEESLGMLMHDLKNNLVGMQMAADVLGDGRAVSDEPYRRLMLENISRSSSQMLAFVNQFLANASTDRQLVIRLEPVCFAKAASRSVQQFQEAARRKDLVVHASLPGKDTLVQADPHALNQVLDNLLSNAVKFSPSGKQISVIVRPAASYVECQVQDQGHGFTPEDQTTMFRRYGKLSARPTGGESSAGLGLSIVKKLMDAMRGELSCESAAGHGARFSLRLPRATAGF